MKMQEARSLVVSELKKNESITPKQINDATAVPMIQIYSTLKQLVELTAVSEQVTDTGKNYSVVDSKKLNMAFEALKVEVAIDKPKPSTIAPTKGRDNSKYVFNKVAYSKSQCALQVVSAYVKDKKPTLKQIKEAFPDSIVSRFGVVNTLQESKELSLDRARYHLSDQHVLVTADKKSIVISNQWTLARFTLFVLAASKVGYMIKPE